MIRTSLAVLVVLAASAVQAAPSGPKLLESIPVDKLYEITHPLDKVGPPVDPSGPLRKLAEPRLEPEPDPWYTDIWSVEALGLAQ